MSQIEDAYVEQFENDGTLDWIRAQANLENPDGNSDAEATDAESPVEDTDEAATSEEVTDEAFDATLGDEGALDDSEETPSAEEEAEMFLDLTPETEAYLSKYGGDLNKALAAAQEAQSLIGRQGNELGDVRQQLAQLTQMVAEGQQANILWPTEDAEPEDAVRSFRSIADTSFDRNDGNTFAQALAAWHEVDPLGAEAYSTLVAARITVMEAQAQTQPDTSSDTQTLAAGVEALKQRYPALADPGFQQEVGAALDKFPTLLGTLQDQTASPFERLGALEEAARLVSSRTADGDVRQAVRRVAVRQSEDARSARAAARVAQGGGRGRPAVQDEDVSIPLGKTGVSVSENDLKAQIKRLTGMDVQVG